MKLNDMPVLYFDEILNGSVNIFSKKNLTKVRLYRIVSLLIYISSI